MLQTVTIRRFIFAILLCLLVLLSSSIVKNNKKLIQTTHLHIHLKPKFLESASPAVPRCQPIKNVVFIKTHKTGSSTIANIMFRFGLRHNLNFALPNTKLYTIDFNYMSKPGEVMTLDFFYPLPDNQEYNILAHHSIYNRTFYHQVMPKNTTYISILREPFAQMVSTYEYYRFENKFVSMSPERFNASNPISSFMENPYIYTQSGTNFTYMRNKQAQDLGFMQEHLEPSKFKEYIDILDKDFDLIMILEYFDESLLILKHQLCWELKDILYIPVNQNIRKRKWPSTDEDRANHKKFSPIDYTLYNHFLSKFTNLLSIQKAEFFQELKYFRTILKEVRFNCMFGRTFTVQATKWHGVFNFTNQDCELSNMRFRQAVGLLYSRSNIPNYKNAHKLIEREGIYNI
ncbi:galactosylceramide sulfotransferase [Biomphalaria pfeifferi]|uniref:Galactosylceramide sulfotransferase n=1 Tax=Biomphalaria pfeifferi TaxID=112525 RepID=A0AAD8BJI9_BIOPF|nr:galactosylceramide sulfotransferase [Biomphalaria pfeifferi]